jgi:DNA-binding XRE family transcriptional regulator
MTSEDFREWRARMRLTQFEAAQCLGLSRATIQSYERGSRQGPQGEEPAEIPKAVRLACAALQLGILDYVWD